MHMTYISESTRPQRDSKKKPRDWPEMQEKLDFKSKKARPQQCETTVKQCSDPVRGREQDVAEVTSFASRPS